jgi:hypothetical protein
MHSVHNTTVLDRKRPESYTIITHCPSGGMVYTADLKSAAEGIAGSSPALGTTKL